MEDRERDLQEFHANIDRKRQEIEAEIEKQRQAVEAEIAAKRKAMEEELVAQRNEMDRRQEEQVNAINRRVNMQTFMARINPDAFARSNVTEQKAAEPVKEEKAEVVEKPVKAVDDKPVEEVTEKTAEEPVEEIVEEPVEKPIKELVAEPVKKEDVKPVEEPVKEEKPVLKLKDGKEARLQTEVKKEDKTETKTESVTEEEPEERPSKWYVTLFKTIGFLLLAILIAILFFFGTIFSFKMLHQSESAPVVYPRAAVLEKDLNGNVINAGDKIVPVLDERINVLVMGTDYGDSEADADEPKRTDAMLLISFGPEDKKVSVLSLPRDTKVILPGHRSAQKLNAAYAFGGVMMAKQTVANLLGVPITHYAIADWRAFIKVVDLIGGVDLLVEHDMKYDDPYADLHIDLKQGYQHLNGEQAGQYVRFRSDELGDIGRAQRQQKFLRAAVSQMFTVSNVVKIPSLIGLISECVQTDMSTLTMLKALNSIKLFGDGKIKTGTLSGTFDDEDDISYWVTDEASIKSVLKELEIPSSKLVE